VASSAENSTSLHNVRASRTACRVSSTTCSRVFFSLYCKWMSEVAINVWIRGCAASRNASHARSMSGRTARARPAITGRRISIAILRTARKILIGRYRDPRLDDVRSQGIQLNRHPQLLLHVHAASRRLFSISQSGIENSDSLFHQFLRLSDEALYSSLTG